jgi:hypothetical protein
MMMAALHRGKEKTGSGELRLLALPVLEEANPNFEGYQANPNGLYEVGLGQYLRTEWTRKIPDNALVKILFDGLPTLPKDKYKIIFMQRDESEIVASIERVEAHWKRYGEANGVEKIDHNEYTLALPLCCLRPYNSEDIKHVLGICEARTDFDVMCIDYAEVIENPLEVFTRLQDWGWPIDPEKCASTIDKSLYRVRKEKCQQQKQECGAMPLKLR